MKSIRCTALLVAATAVLVPAVPANATVIERSHYSGSESFTVDECDGFTLDADVVYGGFFRVREGKGDMDSAYFLTDNYWFTLTLTNPETGRWFTQSGNAVIVEVKAVHRGGTVYEFTSIEAGQPLVVSDSEGKVVLRDRGAITRSLVFDTLGDDVPGGEVIEEFDPVFHGPHPLFDADLCAIAAELTGA